MSDITGQTKVSAFAQKKGGTAGCVICGKRVKAKGWCSAHYNRWYTHGDPLGGGTGRKEARRFYQEVVLTYEGNYCLFWPHSRNSSGYGKLVDDGVVQYVHRLVCERFNGPPPTPKHEAAHACGKGHLGCVTRRHLSWKTRAENAADMTAHGTFAHKLTEADVHQIRSLRGVNSQREIAEQFNIAPSTVSLIHNGKNWAWLS